jgi:hypothetical protein
MTLTGMKKHVGVLERAGLVITEKVGRVRTCKLGPRRLEEETAWIERYRQLWDARFDELDKVVARRWNADPSVSSSSREPSTVLRASCSRRGPMGQGSSFDRATRAALSELDRLASQFRTGLVFAIIVMSALVAPESRRNGSLQFVLSLQVSRRRAALAQFAALSALVTAAAVIVYIVFLTVPLLLGVANQLLRGARSFIATWMARLIDCAGFFYPNPMDLVFWPHLPKSGEGPLELHVFWPIAQLLLAAAFWILLGAHLYRSHDFGSRTAIK